jgi:hypothetical protein
MGRGGGDGAPPRGSWNMCETRVDRGLAYRATSLMAVVAHVDADHVAAQARVVVRLTTVGMV